MWGNMERASPAKGIDGCQSQAVGCTDTTHSTWQCSEQHTLEHCTHLCAGKELSPLSPPPPHCRNAGILGGKFLERMKVAKPDSSPDNPTFYQPQDFAIGATIEARVLSSTCAVCMCVCVCVCVHVGVHMWRWPFF